MPRLGLPVVGALVALLLASGAAEARPSLDPARLARLARYDVLVFADPWKDGIDRGKAIGVFDATPEEVFRVASDYARWKEYLPRVRGSEVVSTSGTASLVEMTADLPWPAGRSQVWARYVAQKLPGEIYRIRFEMVRGSMKKYLGSIYIEPFSPGKTALTYELVAEPDVLAPDSLINRSIRHTALGFVNALRQRVNDLHRLGYLHPLEPAQKTTPLQAPLTPDSVKAKLSR